MKKSTRGGAYILVVMSSLLILTLVLTALTVTATSRNITARYGYFHGMYDLAVAGNEQVFLLMQQKHLAGDMHDYFYNFSRNWELNVTIGHIRDDFFATTTVTPAADNFFYITTFMQRNDFSHTSQIRSRVKILDDYTLAMVELLRIAD
ncbi:MAG: hypothetical protein FWB80_05795 [Defluviitaleaceae bacterium]|nr:hypothetical protein [Defluviitaleaceae bacterium]